MEAVLEKECKQGGKPVLFPLCLDDAVGDTDQAWAASLRRTRHMGDFTNWKNHDAFKMAFEGLLGDLKSSGEWQVVSDKEKQRRVTGGDDMKTDVVATRETLRYPACNARRTLRRAKLPRPALQECPAKACNSAVLPCNTTHQGVGSTPLFRVDADAAQRSSGSHGDPLPVYLHS